jgi:hypothetical protein
MRLQNLLSLTGAVLRSEPAVAQIDAVVLEAHRVHRGDLFVAYDASRIPEAVANGAYAVLHEGEPPVSDPEIAWLGVASLDDALLRLLRFRLLEKSLRAVVCDDVALAVAAQMLTDARCYVLDKPLREAFYDLWDLQEHSWVFMPDRDRYRDLFVQVQSFPTHGGVAVDIAEQTLFETSFVLDDVYYDRMQLSPFFLPYLARFYGFASSHGLEFRVCGMQGSTHFVPVFVGNDLRAKTFGQGGKVLIFEPDLSLLLEEIDFIRTEAKWAKIVYLVPKGSAERFEDNEACLSYESQEDIIHLLKTVPFHFALIGGQDKRLLDSVRAGTEPKTLF